MLEMNTTSIEQIVEKLNKLDMKDRYEIVINLIMRDGDDLRTIYDNTVKLKLLDKIVRIDGFDGLGAINEEFNDVCCN